MFRQIVQLSALVGLASAHFKLTYPPSRGFVEDDEPTAPCGGFNTVGTRTPFSLGSTFITLDSEHEAANVYVMISFDQNPIDIKNFTQQSDGSPQKPLRDFFQVDGEDICIGVDVSSIGYSQATNGTNATIAVQYAGGDGNLYQCADVVLVTSVTPPSNVTCENQYSTTALGSQTSAAPSGTTSGAGSSSTTSTGSAGRLQVGLGALGAALIGIFVAV